MDTHVTNAPASKLYFVANYTICKVPSLQHSVPIEAKWLKVTDNVWNCEISGLVGVLQVRALAMG